MLCALCSSRNYSLNDAMEEGNKEQSKAAEYRIGFKSLD